MMRTSKKSGKLRGVLGAAFCLATAFSLPAEAATTYYKFYSGGIGYTGPYSGAGTVYDATKGLATLCPIGKTCSGSDVFGNPLDFGDVSAQATAGLSGGSGQRVWDDYAPKYGGLGVDTLNLGDGSEDQISGSEVLKLTFDDRVKLTGLATLFVSKHQGFGTGFATPNDVASSSGTINLKISVDGGTWTDYLFAAANLNTLNLDGKEFSFMQATGGPSYYVGAAAVSAVPLPAALPLMATGLALLGFVGRRRKATVA